MYFSTRLVLRHLSARHLSMRQRTNRAKARTYAKGPVFPLAQYNQSRENTVESFLQKKRSTEWEMTEKKGSQRIYERMFNSEKYVSMRNSVENEKSLYGLQFLRDDEPLATSREHNMSPAERLKYFDEYERMREAPPPLSYSTLLSRKVMAGESWPTVPEGFDLHQKEITELEHESNMTPSAKKFANHLLYLLRHQIKACPFAVRCNIDFTELMLHEVIASRRSRNVYIVWSTLHPGARFDIEPHLGKLKNWIKGLICREIDAPNIPNITWVYDHGNLKRKLPKDIARELKSSVSDLNTSNKDRLKYLRRLDSLSNRMKGVPWFMPYLWNKDKKMQRKEMYTADLQEIERRKGLGGQ